MLVFPPSLPDFSKPTTFDPDFAAERAAVKPAPPEPITTISTDSFQLITFSFDLIHISTPLIEFSFAD